MHGGKTFPFQWTLVQGLGLTAQTFVVQLMPGPGGKFNSICTKDSAFPVLQPGQGRIHEAFEQQTCN